MPAFLKGLVLLVKYLPALSGVGKLVGDYVKPGDKYNKNRVIFLILMFVILLLSVAVLGEINTQVALEALDKLCSIVDCD